MLSREVRAQELILLRELTIESCRESPYWRQQPKGPPRMLCLDAIKTVLAERHRFEDRCRDSRNRYLQQSYAALVRVNIGAD